MLLVPAGSARTEITVANSRFIASLSPADSVEAARDYIASIRREYADAAHNVPAFIIGGGNSVTEFCSADGEPSGTSGRPLLAVLKGTELGNVVVVVTRYFGGTLLGTGGLVKAYSEAGRAVLAITGRAELVETRRLAFSVSYHLFEGARMLVAQTGSTMVSEDFAEDVRLVVDVAVPGYGAFVSRLAELSAGAALPRVLSTQMTARRI